MSLIFNEQVFSFNFWDIFSLSLSVHKLGNKSIFRKNTKDFDIQTSKPQITYFPRSRKIRDTKVLN